MTYLVYTAVVANSVPGGSSYAVAINAGGEVVGDDYNTTPSMPEGFSFDAGGVTQIEVPGAEITTPTAVNAAGEIVGTWSGSGAVPGGFVDDAGSISILDAPEASYTLPYAVNDSGQIAGMLMAAGASAPAAFIDTGGVFTTIDLPGASGSLVNAINDAGTVIGQFVATSNNFTYGFADTGGAVTTIDLPGATFVNPTGINASGEIVGTFHDGIGPDQGFVDVGGTITTLDVAGATSTDLVGVNDAGAIVGNTASGGFLDMDGTITHVAYPAAGATTVAGINDSGDIVGDTDTGAGRPVEGFVAAPCYAGGTRIATVRGEVAVQDLRAGMRVLSAFGGSAPVLWVGRRHLDCRAQPWPRAAWPVRVLAGAYAGGVPSRDVLLSPDHCVYIGGVLIPVRCLVNGVTVVREPVSEIDYFHVELPAHDVIFADGLPAESYLDTGNRAGFDNGAAGRADLAEAVWHAEACAAQVTFGAPLAAAIAHLAARARLRQLIGWAA